MNLILKRHKHSFLSSLYLQSKKLFSIKGYLPTVVSMLFFSYTTQTLATETEQQLKNINQHIKQQENTINQQIKQRQSLQKQLQQQDKEIANVATELQKIETNLTSLKKEIATLDESINQLNHHNEQQQTLLSAQLDEAFRQGKTSQLELLFSRQNSQKKARILAYYHYLNQARSQVINELNTTQQKLAKQKITLSDKQQENTSLLQKQQAQLNQLEKIKSTRHDTLTKLEQNLQSNRNRLHELKQNQRMLQDKITQAETRQKKSIFIHKPSQQERALLEKIGGLGKPHHQYLPPVDGKVIHHFGEQLQGELFWKGMVIRAPEGSNVRAIANGQVVLADWLHGYGLVIVIDHGKGDMSVYGYNQNALITVGQYVKEGQPIALVGLSGGQKQASLYFEIRRQGQAIDPENWLKK